MRQYGLMYALVLVIGLAVIAGALSLIFANFIDFQGMANGKQADPAAFQPLDVIRTPQPAQPQLLYNPPRPEDAPQDIREAVILGHNILSNTKQYAAAYTGNDLNCTNCHFNAGISGGGKNGGLSLVGVAAAYPKYRSRQNYAVDLVTRTNDCFTRSQNGKPLPPDSKEMVAILTYYKWISTGVPIYDQIPWLGAAIVKTQQAPDQNAGQQVYATSCAACHGADGKGTNIAPALWGDGSYNDGAGMSKAETLTSFAFHNMPRGNPILSTEEAANVALFVDSQPRPHYQK